MIFKFNEPLINKHHRSGNCSPTPHPEPVLPLRSGRVSGVLHGPGCVARTALLRPPPSQSAERSGGGKGWDGEGLLPGNRGRGGWWAEDVAATYVLYVQMHRVVLLMGSVALFLETMADFVGVFRQDTGYYIIFGFVVEF